MSRLPRILTAVPRTPHVRWEIARAIQTLTAPAQEQEERHRADWPAQKESTEFAKQIARDALRDVLKANFNPNEPRVPAGNPDGGEWANDGGSGGEVANDRRVISDATPDNIWIPDVQYAANDHPGIGHNLGPPLEEPPKVPPQEPATKQVINAFLKAAAYWLVSAAARADKRMAVFVAALQATQWLVDKYLPYITAYRDPPKTWEELQQNALRTRPGYDIHHPVEQTPARDDGFPNSVVDGPGNRISIPTLKHWQINGWYGRPNPEFKDKNSNDLSPRDYLRGKSWDERLRVGKEALILFGVLTP